MVTPLTLLLLENSLAEAQQWLEMLTPNRPAEGGDETAWHVTHVYNADEGLEHLKQTQFDAALLGLADRKDLETIDRIESIAPQLPLVVLSDLKDQKLALQAVAKGAQDYLLKNQISRDVLSRVIRYAIERGQILHRLHQEITEREQSEQILRHLVAGTAAVTGADFFQALVRSLAQSLQVRYAMISGCIDTPPTRVCTYAFWQGDSFGENETYDLYGTPCEQVFKGQGCQYYPQRLQALFPLETALVDMQAESYAGIPLFSSSGQILGHLAVIDDNILGNEERNTKILEIFAARAAAEIERQQTAEALKQSQEQLARLAEIGELASMIVHEIRNPLTTLLMGLNSFKRLALPERFQTYLGLALDEGERLTRLLNQILVYAKPQNLELTELNLNEWLTGLLDSLKTMPAAAGRQLFYTPFPKPVKVLADADKLKQVVINLVANAFEAIPPGETVTLAVQANPSIQLSNHSVQSIPSSVCIRVHNGGAPIPTDVLPKLTQPFVTTKTNGTGLGLAIVKRIVEAHNGNLQIESDLETGTTFTVVLPHPPEHS
jgi:signal transduction histidine kinase/ActR/RegA family two-component response regulator